MFERINFQKKTVFATCLILFQWAGLAQKSDTYNIKHSQGAGSKKCKDYNLIYNRLPVEVRYGIEVVDGDIFFAFPNQQYFDLIFDKKTDGIAVDIIKREQYQCYDKNQLAQSWAYRGYLMPPLYRKDMMAQSVFNPQGFVLVRYGKLPDQFDASNIECNLLVLQKKSLCGYHSFSNLDYANWELLETGLYRDSLSSDELDELHQEISKTLKFTIPFEKNKGVFKSNDIQPLYDSLHLTDYNIKQINIRAYTSVEGSKERNLSLQQERVSSIVNALQAYQKPEILSAVSVNENWVEFMNDIGGTQFEYMASFSKEEIKHELNRPDIAEQIEPILIPHRKALIELKLQKKFSESENDLSELKRFFDQTISSENIKEALYLQEIILERIKDGQIPENFIDKLEIPEETVYGPLLNNLAVFRYESNDLFLNENIANFEKMLEILPDNIRIIYNITALKIKALTQGELITNHQEIKKLLDKLNSLGLNKSLLYRLQVNYHIILTEYYHQQKNYKAKNKSLKEVYWLYSRVHLNDEDLLSMVKYLSYYSKFDWAENILEERIGQVDASEDLIFYYLRLTISKPQQTRQIKYRTFMLNALEKNQSRFCDLFLPKSQGGYTFQLLDDEYLRKTYCENCYEE